MSNDAMPEAPKAPRVSLYDRATPPRPLVPFDRSALTPKRDRKPIGRGPSAARFPVQYEGRALKSQRINVGSKRTFLGEVLQDGIDVRQSSGDRAFETVRYLKGRHPSESVAHYEARRGR